MSKPAAALHKDGVVLLRNVLSDSTLDKARDIANTHFSELLRALLLQQVFFKKVSPQCQLVLLN